LVPKKKGGDRSHVEFKRLRIGEEVAMKEVQRLEKKLAEDGKVEVDEMGRKKLFP